MKPENLLSVEEFIYQLNQFLYKYEERDNYHKISKRWTNSLREQHPHVVAAYHSTDHPIIIDSLFKNYYRRFLLPLLDIWRDYPPKYQWVYEALQRDICRWLAYRTYYHTQYLYYFKSTSKDLPDYEEKAFTLNKLFDKYWYETESNTIRRVIRLSYNFISDLERVSDIYPNVELQVNYFVSEQPRYEIIRPFSDPVWRRYLPPNDFESPDTFMCSDQEAKGSFDALYLHPALDNNPVYSGRIFSDQHYYYQNVRPEIASEIDKLAIAYFQKNKEDLTPPPKTQGYSFVVTPDPSNEKSFFDWVKRFFS